jgi:hypothetical protein
MDIISHGLWGALAFGRENQKKFVFAFALSILPDILSEGLMFTLIFLGLRGMPSLANGHPNITEFPLYAQNFYNATHSLIIFTIVFLLVWFIIKKPIWIMLTWALHILIDIPTHSLELFPTPFLWPVSSFKVNGIGWDTPIILILDISLLVLVYVVVFYPRLIKMMKKKIK